MKTTFTIVAIACALASSSAFAPLATRAVGKKPAAKKAVAKKKPVAKKVVAKKPVAKKVVAKKAAPPSSKGYPSIRSSTESFKPWTGISGGGNRGPSNVVAVPDFSDPSLQIDRDPAFYAAAAKTRQTPYNAANAVFVYDDGLTTLERKQRKTIPAFLTGSAQSQADKSTIRSDLEGEDFAFGLDADRFQLLFISIFGLFTLVGCLSGALQL